ncbi:MAG: T9SS type A sorting domain-containing protein, partial [Chitinophagaceae bacterium]|nr:T9SS type A sorting domain-containing protein [Chitinophagaceae bacterium]
PFIGNTYYPDPSVSVNSSVSVVKTSTSTPGRERMEIQNIVKTFANCSASLDVQGDIWASQAANKKNVHCASPGIALVLNDPRVTGLKNCSQPRTYNVSITTPAVSSMNVLYNVYKDDGDGIFEPNAGDGAPIDQVTNINISSSSPYSANNVSYPGGNVGGESSSLWIEVKKTSGGSFSTLALFQNTCSPLPVQFKSFTAARTKQNVSLKWQTVTEQNNKGFYVQRNTNGTWQNIAFVPSQAIGGNSEQLLSYQYNDVNAAKGINQYRIQQIDLDSRARFSEVRSVRGEAQIGKLIVYPNPSTTGKVSISFDDNNNLKNVLISDISGRVVKQWRNVSTNSLQLENLENGYYNVQVTDLALSETYSGKIIIVKK